MYYQRGWQDTLIVLDLQPGDTLFYNGRNSGVHEFDLLGQPNAKAPLRVDGHLLAIELAGELAGLPGSGMGRDAPLAVDGVQLWLDRRVGEGLRLALFDLDGRICPPLVLWPRGAAAPPIPLDDAEGAADGWQGSHAWLDGSVWRLQARGSEVSWRVQQAEREYVLDPQLLRWQAARDARRREGLPLAEMQPFKPQRVGEPLTLIYRGPEREVQWACDGHIEQGAVAEIAFHRVGAYAVQLTVGSGEARDAAVQWVMVHGEG